MNGMEAFATVELPADIGKRQLATLWCKVDTGAGGNVMPLRAFSKLFQERFNTDGHPTGLTPSNTRLSAYNGSTNQAIWNIRHPHRLDTKRYQDHQPPPHMMVCC